MIWFIGDTHFGHKNIRKYCGRPYDHMKRMLYSLKVCVGPEDTLIHLGDFSFFKQRGFFERIPGKTRILVQGNHDKKYTKKLAWDKFIAHDKQPYEMEIEGYKVFLAHNPKKRIYKSKSIFIHGHIHEKGVPHKVDRDQLIIHTSVEQWDYWPISWETIKKIYHKQIESEEMHNGRI